jgi:hypothetical protein
MTDQHTPLVQDDDPRSISDDKLRAEHPREEVERWREDALIAHSNWLEVAGNRYGKG